MVGAPATAWRAPRLCWTKALGGVSNAARVELRLGALRFGAGTADHASESAYTVVSVVLLGPDESLPPAHAALGEMVYDSGISTVSARLDEGVRVSVSRGDFVRGHPS